MQADLSRNYYLVKEHVGMFKSANNFDIFDPETGEMILLCREERLGAFTKMLRFTDFKRMTPFNIEVTTPTGQPVVRIQRGVALFLSTVDVFDETDTRIGGFKQKFFSLGGAFTVLNANDEPVCKLKGKWTGWNFKFLAENHELAHVSKKFAGFSKEIFTSADNYILEIANDVPPNSPIRKLILAAVLCIDMVLKE